MIEEKRRILEMLSQGKLSVADAEKLLNAISENKSDHYINPTLNASQVSSPKYLRVQVESNKDDEEERVNIKVPFQLLRSGMKLAALMPNGVQDKVNTAFKEKGIDFDFSKIKNGSIEELIQQLSEISIDVENKNEKVRIFCE